MEATQDEAKHRSRLQANPLPEPKWERRAPDFMTAECGPYHCVVIGGAGGLWHWFVFPEAPVRPVIRDIDGVLHANTDNVECCGTARDSIPAKACAWSCAETSLVWDQDSERTDDDDTWDGGETDAS